MPILLPGDAEPDAFDEFPVYARSGWHIPQEKPDRISIELMRIQAEELMRWRPGIVLRSLSTYPYNCVGMVFASRRAWIDIDYIYQILKEDGYRRIRREEVEQGDIVLYKGGSDEPVHVALIVMIERYGESLNIQVISKWGREAEFVHFEDDVVPALGTPAEYYTDRVGS